MPELWLVSPIRIFYLLDLFTYLLLILKQRSIYWVQCHYCNLALKGKNENFNY